MFWLVYIIKPDGQISEVKFVLDSELNDWRFSAKKAQISPNSGIIVIELADEKNSTNVYNLLMFRKFGQFDSITVEFIDDDYELYGFLCLRSHNRQLLDEAERQLQKFKTDFIVKKYFTFEDTIERSKFALKLMFNWGDSIKIQHVLEWL